MSDTDDWPRQERRPGLRHPAGPFAPLVLLAAAALCLPALAPGEAASVRWDRIVGADASRLNADQRQRAVAIMQREFCYFGCSRSIARCLEAQEPSRTAQRLGGYVVRQVLEGRTDDEISEGIRQRGLSAHPLQPAQIDLANAECVGPADAAITVVEYADFECPFCRVVSPILHKLAGRMRPAARLCFKHFPVRGHSRAVPAAIAVLAAGRQGRFWQMHDALYASAPRLAEGDIARCAERARVPDLARWQRDRQGAALTALVEADKLEGIRNGVRGTPSIFVNGKEYLGQKNEAELRDRLEEELDLVQSRP